MPSALVVIRRYPVLGAAGYSGAGAGVGADERRLLSAAGVESYVKLDRLGSVSLMVPESQLDAARRALAGLPDLYERHFAPPCPRCHAPHPAARPPYEMFLVGTGLLGAVGVVLAGWHLSIAYGLVTATVIGGAVIYSHFPMWRCHSCGCAYGGRSDDRGNVLNFPRRSSGRR
jgi:hypothetical protein